VNSKQDQTSPSAAGIDPLLARIAAHADKADFGIFVTIFVDGVFFYGRSVSERRYLEQAMSRAVKDSNDGGHIEGLQTMEEAASGEIFGPINDAARRRDTLPEFIHLQEIEMRQGEASVKRDPSIIHRFRLAAVSACTVRPLGFPDAR
jgi:hypothetical protein